MTGVDRQDAGDRGSQSPPAAELEMTGMPVHHDYPGTAGVTDVNVLPITSRGRVLAT